EREDPRDALVAPRHRALERLPGGARVGTSSLRRGAQLKAHRPDLEIVPIRGNVATRLGKVEKENLDGVVLALAGLRRLGLASHATEILDVFFSVPAIGQGALGIECRVDDAPTNALVAALNHAESATTAAAERAFLLRLGGGCQVPLGAHATLSDGGGIAIHAFVGTPDGVRVLRGEQSGRAPEAEQLGRALADDLLAQGAGEILREVMA
ncbi:MAG: hydroxymethylbilane synthase, partial [Myxococcota bacterium]